jgi:hypothetical protein
MAGFDNDVVYGINADYSNTLAGTGASTVGQLLTNGQLWIGTTAANPGGTHINVGALNSPDGSITFGFSSPNITATVTGGSTTVLKLMGNTGLATPSAGIINVITANTTVQFVGSGNTLTQDFGQTNLVIGNSGTAITVGAAENTGLGLNVFTALTSGTFNTAAGTNALKSVTTGEFHTAIGAEAGVNMVTQIGMTAIGYAALNKSTIGSNTAVGANCLSQSVTGNSCVAVGYSSLANATSSSHTSIGHNALGLLAGGSGQNTALGAEVATNLLTGANDILIGFSAGSNYTAAESNNILIGSAGVTSESNAIHIGTQGSGAGQQNTCFIAGITGVTVSNPVLVTLNSSTGQLGNVASVNNGVLTTGTTGIPVITALASNGQLIIGSGAGAPAAATLTAGAGISITNGANSITIASTSAGFTWSETSGAFNAVKENGYFITTTATATLPASPAEGDTIKFSVDTTNILTITANTGQTLRFSSAVSASAGTAASTKQGDSVELTYKSTGTVWIAQNFVGSWTIT